MLRASLVRFPEPSNARFHDLHEMQCEHGIDRMGSRKTFNQDMYRGASLCNSRHVKILELKHTLGDASMQAMHRAFASA